MKVCWCRAGIGILLVVGLFSAGCNGEGSSGTGGDSVPAGVGLTGTWDYSNPMDSGIVVPGTFYLTQTGTAISGTFREHDDASQGTVSGTVSGNMIALTLSFSVGSVDSATGTVDGDTINGTWREEDTGETGVFVARRRT